MSTNSRLKVEKNVNSKAVLIKLSFNYFLVFILLIVIQLVVLINGFSGPKLFIFCVGACLTYMLMRYLDGTGLVEGFSIKTIPGNFENDLYKLKDGDCKLIKEPTNTIS